MRREPQYYGEDMGICLGKLKEDTNNFRKQRISRRLKKLRKKELT